MKVELPSFMGDDWDDEDEDDDVVPTLLEVALGCPLIYPGRSHYLAGTGGDGKTWTMQHALAETVKQNPDVCVAFVDYEDDRRSFRKRLKALGILKEEASRIAYWKVDQSIMRGTTLGQAWLGWCYAFRPVLVVIDSVSKACAAAGLDDESNPQFQSWDNGVIVPLTMLGIATMRIDHTGHDDDGGFGTSRKKTRARGASSKKDAVSGASYLHETTEPWSKESNGKARWVVIKDRHGTRKKNEVACEIDVAVLDGGRDVKLVFKVSAAPSETSTNPIRRTWYMEAISKQLELTPNLSKGQIEKTIGKNAGYVREALAMLVREGYVVTQPGSRNATLHKISAQYRQDTDPLSETFQGDSNNPMMPPGPKAEKVDLTGAGS